MLDEVGESSPPRVELANVRYVDAAPALGQRV
jgi:hypothetical protein